MDSGLGPVIPGAGLLTPELTETLAKLIATGNYPEVACRGVGISPDTFKSWMTFGSAVADGPYKIFYDTIKQAEAIAEMYAVQKWHEQLDRNHQAPRDFLARRFTKRWGEKIEIGVAVRTQLEEILTRLRVALPPEVFAQVAGALGSDEVFVQYMEGRESDPDDEVSTETGSSPWNRSRGSGGNPY